MKYSFMAFIQQTASSTLQRNLQGRAALILVVLVVVDIKFIGNGPGLARGCGGGTVDEEVVVKKKKGGGVGH